MAGRGPEPKDPAARRRSNAPARGDWVDLAPLSEPVLPALSELAAPQLVDEDTGAISFDWPEPTAELWEGWRWDPSTAMWTSSDRALAVDALRLHALNSARYASEVRLRMDTLGLTQKGKRDNRWRVSEAPAPAAAEAPAQPRTLRAV